MTNDTETTIQTLAGKYYAMLEMRKRDNGDMFICRKDDLNETDSEELRSLCWAAHSDGEYFPDDYRYDWLNSFLNEIADNDEGYIIMVEPDCYTHDLTKWLNSNINRVSYLDEALIEGMGGAGFDALSYAQYLEKQETLDNIIAWLENKIEELDN